ncbi:helix-turn-helix domain-containing protein [Vagococcus sp. AM17-17]|nr:helix-turn-helix domain-containing protein [Vagococcus sp. AM17-17]
MESLELKDKIKLLRKENGLTQLELAKRLDVASTSVSSWERGANKPLMDKIEVMAQMFDVPLSYFFKDIELFKGDIISVPIIGEIACGDPITANENILGYRDRSSTNLPAGDLFYLKAKGDSMEPKIPDCSFVLIREQPDVENGEIAAVLVNGDTEATLKRVRKVQDSLILEPLNPDYNPYIVNENNPARILGKAIEVTSVL